MLRWAVVLLVLPPLVGCEATATGSLREGEAWNEPVLVTFTASPGRSPVDVSEKDFKAFMREMGPRVTDARFKAVMQELGGHVRTASSRPEGRVVFASWEPTAGRAPAQGFREYLRWCQPRARCIALPDDGEAFGVETRRAVALDVALRSIWPGVVEAVGDMLEVRQLEAMAVTSLVIYLGLLAAPSR